MEERSAASAIASAAVVAASAVTAAGAAYHTVVAAASAAKKKDDNDYDPKTAVTVHIICFTSHLMFVIYYAEPLLAVTAARREKFQK